MTEVHKLPLADTSDMIGLHRVFRNALAAAPQLVASVEPGDTKRAELVASYYLNVLSLLHTHHEGEDELLTPKLLDRCPEQSQTIARIAAQHVRVLSALADAESQAASWPADPTEKAGAELVRALGELEENLTPHLDDEERDLLPIAAQHINVAEWGALPAHGMRHFTGDKMWLIFGLVQEQMTPAQIADMNAHTPPELAQFWATTGQQLFDDYLTELNRP